MLAVVRATSHRKELYNTNSPSDHRQNYSHKLCVHVPRVAAATTQGWDHYGIYKTFVVTAATVVYQEPHF